jgi:2,3-bisphosphoglycerate-independent phosphoglycerate mutase
MTPYESSFTGVHILFPKQDVTNTLGEIVSKNGMRQLRIAETEKFAHVTFFFSGGRDLPFDNEDRILIPSPKVATYDLQPEMSAPEVAAALTNAMDQQVYDCIILNFANGDMVGHTGVYEAIRQAVVTIDICVDSVVRSAQKNGYEVIIIADHGNADYAVNEDGTPNTAHSLNPVPCVYIPSPANHKDPVNATVSNGILADVAPTLCHLLGIRQPEEMTGHNLITIM